MRGLGEFLRQTGLLGARALRRYYRVPANPISTLLFPLMQLFVFSQLFKEIVSVPGFTPEGAGGGSYLNYLAPGQVAFTVFFATAWAGGNLLVDPLLQDRLQATNEPDATVLDRDDYRNHVECDLRRRCRVAAQRHR